MKINITITVSDELRRRIADYYNLPTSQRVAHGLAPRPVMKKFLVETAALASSDETRIFRGARLTLTDEQQTAAADASAYLRVMGKSEDEITAWLLMQFARIDALRQVVR